MVNINDHENDSAFSLSAKNEGDELIISDKIMNMDKLPRRYTLVQNGKKNDLPLKGGFSERKNNRQGRTVIRRNGY